MTTADFNERAANLLDILGGLDGARKRRYLAEALQCVYENGVDNGSCIKPPSASGESTQQGSMRIELHGIEDQIRKRHFLNVHFRAFKLANDAWQEHIRQNALAGSRGGFVAGTSPAGAVLDDDRSDS